MFAFIKSGFTTSAGELDDARVSAFMVVLTFIGNSILSVYHGAPFDAQQFGIGAGALFAGAGAWFGIRKDN